MDFMAAPSRLWNLWLNTIPFSVGNAQNTGIETIFADSTPTGQRTWIYSFKVSR